MRELEAAAVYVGIEQRSLRHALRGPCPLDALLAMTLHRAKAVSRPFPSWNRSILTEIYLFHACSCQEILRTETAGQGQDGLSVCTDSPTLPDQESPAPGQAPPRPRRSNSSRSSAMLPAVVQLSQPRSNTNSR
jgi:hypothetical protein